jgi:alpha-ribazole phosphatase
MRLILVRHPKPRCEPGLCYGRLDLECETQALETAVSRLRDLAAAACVFSSPARRAFDLASRLDAHAIADPRLQELNFGDWEGRRWQDLGREAIDVWRQGLPGSAPPNGETLTAMAARCADWIASLEAGARPILAVTHAGPIRVIRAMIEDQPLLTYFTAAIPFAEPIELRLNRLQPIGRPSLQPAARV